MSFLIRPRDSGYGASKSHAKDADGNAGNTNVDEADSQGKARDHQAHVSDGFHLETCPQPLDDVEARGQIDFYGD